MYLSLVNFGDSSSGIGALGFDVKAFIIQLITFVLAFLVLKRYAFGPITKLLQQRRETIEKGVSLGEEMQKKQAELEAKVDKTLQDSRVKADKIIANAQETARSTIHEAEDKAKQKTEGILKSAEDRIDQETSRARQQLKKELIGLVADTTETIMEQKVDAKKDAELIEKALTEQRA